VGNIHGVQISFFSFSAYQNEHETYITMGMFSCVKWTERKLNT